MRLSLPEAAHLLQVSERTVKRWVDRFDMPCERGPDGPVFDRNRLIAWADRYSFRLAAEVPGEEEAPLPELGDALEEGGIHHGLEAAEVEDALAEVSRRLRLPDLVDREFLHQVLLAREDLGSTGIGNGIALPHVRAPLVLHVAKPLVGLFFLERAIDWGAIDGKPVDTLFTLLSPGVRQHLHLLSRISFCLRDPDLQKLLAARAEAPAILNRVRELDRGIRENNRDS